MSKFHFTVVFYRFVPTHLKVKRPDGRPGIGPGLPGSKPGKKGGEEEKKMSMFTQPKECNQLHFFQYLILVLTFRANSRIIT